MSFSGPFRQQALVRLPLQYLVDAHLEEEVAAVVSVELVSSLNLMQVGAEEQRVEVELEEYLALQLSSCISALYNIE